MPEPVWMSIFDPRPLSHPADQSSQHVPFEGLVHRIDKKQFSLLIVRPVGQIAMIVQLYR